MNLDRRLDNITKTLEDQASAAFERVWEHLTLDEFDLAAAYKKKPKHEQESPTAGEMALAIRLWDLMTLREKLILCALCEQSLADAEAAYDEWRELLAREADHAPTAQD